MAGCILVSSQLMLIGIMQARIIPSDVIFMSIKLKVYHLFLARNPPAPSGIFN
jgi:hypothetical protein